MISKRRAGQAAPGTKTVWHYIGQGLSGALLILVIALGVLTLAVPKATGSVPLAILTSSMEPGLPPGTLIIVKPLDPDALRTGDVATYQIESGRPEVVTHRITAVNTSSDGTRTFTFQGDNNTGADSEQVLPEQINGVLWYSVPLLGYVSVAMNGPLRAYIVPIAGSLLLAYAAITMTTGAVAAIRKRRNKTVELGS